MGLDHGQIVGSSPLVKCGFGLRVSWVAIKITPLHDPKSKTPGAHMHTETPWCPYLPVYGHRFTLPARIYKLAALIRPRFSLHRASPPAWAAHRAAVECSPVRSLRRTPDTTPKSPACDCQRAASPDTEAWLTAVTKQIPPSHTTVPIQTCTGYQTGNIKSVA